METKWKAGRAGGESVQLDNRITFCRRVSRVSSACVLENGGAEAPIPRSQITAAVAVDLPQQQQQQCTRPTANG